MPVTVVHFNPGYPRVRGPLGRILREPLNNFGDMLGPQLVQRIVDSLGLREPKSSHRLVSVGSVMKLARPGDTVWGTGVNGKSLSTGAGASLDIRAVRGPLTRNALLEAGATVPIVFGDPGLLWSRFWPRSLYLPEGPRRDVSVLPNYHDAPTYAHDNRFINARLPLDEVISAIARSHFVCGSSLHAIVLAESFGIPARLIKSEHEPPFKYDDYYGGTGRASYQPARTVQEAIDMGGEQPPIFDEELLLQAFPSDLWERQGCTT